MKVICRCGSIFESLIIDKNKAIEEVYTKLIGHALKSHSERVREIQQLTMVTTKALVFVTTLKAFGVIPDGELVLQEELDKCEEAVMKALGYDPEVKKANENESVSVSDPN